MTMSRLIGKHRHHASQIAGLEEILAAAGGVIIHDATALTDGVEDTFTTPSEFATGRVRVFLNGLMQRPGVDFTEVGDDGILMADPPAEDDELIIVYGTDGSVPLAFTQLADVPSSYAGEGEKLVVVKSDETGLEFIDAPTSGTGKYDVRVPPTSPNSMDDEFNDESGMSGTVNGLDAKWTQRNQSTTTYTFPHVGRLKVTPPTSATAAWRIIDQPLPSGDCTFEMKIGLNSRQANFASCGMVAVDGTNGDFLFHGIGTAAVGTANPPQQILRQLWTNVTTFSAQATARNYGPNTVYIKMERISGAWWFWYSSDGESWVNMDAAVADIGATRIGIGGSHEHNHAGTFWTVEYFRRTV